MACIMSDNVLAVGLFWRNDLGCASVVPSEQTSSSYIILYRLFIIGSAEALPILCVRYFRWERERERERERCRERERERERERKTDGSDVTIVALKLAMNRRWNHCGAEIRNEFTLSIAKTFFALFVPPPDEWSKTQDKWSNLAQSYFVLPIEKMNQINTKNYWN